MKSAYLVHLLCLCAIFNWALQCRANVAGGGTTGDAVTLQDGGKTVVLSNGIVSATISKSGASLSSLKYRKIDMLNSGYYSMDGGTDYRTPSNCAFTIKSQSPDLIDIAMRHTWKDEPQAFDIEVHYVLQRGGSGVYSYAILDHPANYPRGHVGEWRMVWKLSNDTLENIYVDELRHWQMPSSEDYKHADPTGIKEIVKINTGVRAGQYDCKYDFNASYYDIRTWGHASNKNKVGGFIVLGSCEFLNDGPTKQDLNAASGINHMHFGMDHYNCSVTDVPAGEAWQKIYGPFLLYCNHADTADACWADAKAQVKAEQSAWPYAWLTKNPIYPLESDRGLVSGRFIVNDRLKPKLTGANAWVGLANPPAGGNWQFDSMGYQFWVKTDENGNFTIPHVRPGTYTLYVFVNGAVGEFSLPGINVKARKAQALGDVRWNVPHSGNQIAWEIGVPDRTAGEFRHGTDYFHGYVWQNFYKEFSNPLEYTIGKSDPATDWNYAQSRIGEPGKEVPHVWNIHFNLDRAPTGSSTLVLAIASAYRATIEVSINGESKPFAAVTPKVQGGNALLRESIHAKYCVEYLAIPAGKLRAGANTISLALRSARDPQAHVMYDYLCLELP